MIPRRSICVSLASVPISHSLGGPTLKRVLATLALMAWLSPLGCSDEDTGGSAAVFNAVEAFNAVKSISRNAVVQPCLEASEFQNLTCNCDVEGEVKALNETGIPKPNQEFSYIQRPVINCQVESIPTSGGDPEVLAFTGSFGQSIQLSPDPLDLQLTFSRAGNCQALSGPFVEIETAPTEPNTCSGTIQAICNQESVTCTVPADCSEMTLSDCS